MEAGHGKGAPDGIGAVVKREADTLVNTHETDITGASALMRGNLAQTLLMCLKILTLCMLGNLSSAKMSAA